MDRVGDKLIPSEYEIAAFNFKPVLTVNDALETVTAFESTADNLQNQLEVPLDEDLDGGVIDPQLISERYEKAQRAASLRTASRNIARLCAPEMAEIAVQEFRQAK